MKNKVNCVIFFILIFMAAFTFSCSNGLLDSPASGDSTSRAIAEPTNSESIFTNNGNVIGSARVVRDGNRIAIKVELHDEYVVKESKTWVGARLDDVPHNKGTVIQGQFPYKFCYTSLQKAQSIFIPLIWADNTVVHAFSYLTVAKVADTKVNIDAHIGNQTYTQIKSNRAYFSFAIQPLQYSITYVGNGNDSGEAPVDSNMYLNGASATVAGNNTLAKSGYILHSWNTNADGTGTDFTPGSTLIFSDHNLILYAKWIKQPQSITMINVEGGTFTMGETYQDIAMPRHSVTLSSFSISATEVTQELYNSTMGVNPSYFTGDLTRPVETVTWYDAVIFCNKLSIREGLAPVYEISNMVPSTGSVTSATVVMDISKNGYRLPTEAEWEFAARGGLLSMGYSYSGSNRLTDSGWSFYNAFDNATHSVGTKIANELGIYDMTGNVFEWCWDWFTTYTDESQNNPTGSSSETGQKVIRGGSYGQGDSCTLIAFRLYTIPQCSYFEVGFRVARSNVN